MQDILDHLTELTASEPAAAAVEAELPVARPGEVLKVVNANLLEVAQTSKKPAQGNEPDTFEGC